MMYHINLILIISFFVSTLLFAKERWEIDKAHSSIHFEAEHIVVMQSAEEAPDNHHTVGTTQGSFHDFEIDFVQGKSDFSKSKLEAIIRVSSINTKSVLRDSHLRSKDFFETDKYPLATFKSHSFKKVKDKTFKITGDLTIKDVTKTITLDAKLNADFIDLRDNNYISFSATVLINRLDYGLQWSELLEKGAFRISNYISLIIQTNLVKEKHLPNSQNSKVLKSSKKKSQ